MEKTLRFEAKKIGAETPVLFMGTDNKMYRYFKNYGVFDNDTQEFITLDEENQLPYSPVGGMKASRKVAEVLNNGSMPVPKAKVTGRVQ